MNNRNKGFSYVEMMIVLAIMGIMIGFLTISIGTNRRNEVARTSEKLETMVNSARTSALTKGTSQGYINLAFDDNAIYSYVGGYIGTVEGIKAKGEKLCSGRLNVYFSTDGVQENGIINMQFKQSTGGLADGSDYTSVMVIKDTVSRTFTIDGVTGKIKRN